MIKHLAGTTLTRIIATGLGFLTIILAARALGTEEYGNIGIFILTISLFQLATGIAGGPALVYLVPRKPLRVLFLVSLLWAVITHVAGFAILTLVSMAEPWLPAALTVISFMVFMHIFSATVLLGQNRIVEYNSVILLQATTMLITLLIHLNFTPHPSFNIYLSSFLISQTASAAFAWWLLRNSFTENQSGGFFSNFAETVRYGGFLQMANGLQLLNYRLSFFLIDHYLGRSMVGIYNAGVQLSEGIWIFGKSFAVVQYSKISNNKDPNYATKITLALLKATFAITLVGVLILILLPKQFYIMVLGAEFGNVKTVIFYMSPGILALSVSQIFSHYFSGTGRQHYNAWGSAIGLAVTVVCGFTLIPSLGLPGAALTASAAYMAMTIFQFFVFVKISNCKLGDFAVNKNDIEFIRQQIKAAFSTRRVK